MLCSGPLIWKGCIGCTCSRIAVFSDGNEYGDEQRITSRLTGLFRPYALFARISADKRIVFVVAGLELVVQTAEALGKRFPRFAELKSSSHLNDSIYQPLALS